MIAALGARVHLYVRPAHRKSFTALFRDVLGCDVRELDFGFTHPILLVSFPGHSAFSVEFSDQAVAEPTVVDDEHAFRGAWIEFRADDVAAVHGRLREAGVRSFSHPGSPHAYFMAPGGQVFRVIALDYEGP